MDSIKNKNLKGFSLIEMLVSMVIISIIIVMLSSTLIIALEVALKSFARSTVRDEQNRILTSIEKDVRNARYIESCGTVEGSSECRFALDKNYIWRGCQHADGSANVCKYITESDGSEVLMESLPEEIVVDQFRIEEGFSESPGKISIVVTMVVHHRSERYEINNQIRQIIISTRNYQVL